MSNLEIKLAATLMIVSKNHKVLMVRRNDEIVFAGGAYVFPGGQISEFDSNSDYSKICEYPQNPMIEGEKAAKIAAIRETFEETGLLFAKNNKGQFVYEEYTSLIEQRRKIEKSPEYFHEFLLQNNLHLDLDCLVGIAIWQPPQHITKRFLTWFFVARIDDELNAIVDGREAVEAIWIDPKDAFDDAMAKTKQIIFPTRCNLALLAHHRPNMALWEYASSRPPPLINPQMQKIDGELMICIPANIGYPHFCESPKNF